MVFKLTPKSRCFTASSESLAQVPPPETPRLTVGGFPLTFQGSTLRDARLQRNMTTNRAIMVEQIIVPQTDVFFLVKGHFFSNQRKNDQITISMIKIETKRWGNKKRRDWSSGSLVIFLDAQWQPFGSVWIRLDVLKTASWKFDVGRFAFGCLFRR